jgi:hypothetical protein
MFYRDSLAAPGPAAGSRALPQLMVGVLRSVGRGQLVILCNWVQLHPVEQNRPWLLPASTRGGFIGWLLLDRGGPAHKLMSGGDERVCARLLVQRFGGQVDAVGPGDCARFGIDDHLSEK